ncbi:MAG: DUF3320 domain-containing protein [Chitinophagales bacterium]
MSPECADRSRPLPGTTAYRPLKESWTTFDKRYSNYRDANLAEAEAIVASEGPIHLELAVRRLVRIWGWEKAGARLAENARYWFDLAAKQGRVKVRGHFLWPLKMDAVPVRVPDPEDAESARKIEHICPEEIQAALLLVAHHAVGIGVDSLVVEVARLFGFSRTGDKIRDAIVREYQALRTKGMIG